MPEPPDFWEALFGPATGAPAGAWMNLRLVRKHGRPFLLLPRQRRAAALSLSLYPAQTPRARAARALLRWAVGGAIPLGTRPLSFAIAPEDDFVRFIASLAGEPKPALPTMGILAGNPAKDDQRFLILVFDAGQNPVAVVKAGLSERAQALVEKERALLAAMPPNLGSVPRLRAHFQSPRQRALAMDFAPGDSPRPRDEGALPALLTSWVDTQRTLALGETADWQRLTRAVQARELPNPLLQRLPERTVPATLQHGDFAPWNIKVSPASGAWTVLDWERGELAGIPGWDWFHYVLQPAILVERLPVAGLVQRMEGLLRSEAFLAYAERAGIRGCERELALAYLIHAAEVIKPAEGLAATNELRRALAARWQWV